MKRQRLMGSGEANRKAGDVATGADADADVETQANLTIKVPFFALPFWPPPPGRSTQSPDAECCTAVESSSLASSASQASASASVLSRASSNQGAATTVRQRLLYYCRACGEDLLESGEGTLMDLQLTHKEVCKERALKKKTGEEGHALIHSLRKKYVFRHHDIH